MALNSASIEKTAGWYGFLTGIACIVFALIMRYANLMDILALRAVFIIIMAVGVVSSIASLKRGLNGRLNYLQGIGVGATTALVASLLFGLVILLLISFADPSIMRVFQSDSPNAEPTTFSSIFMVITMAGIVGGALIAFIAMQYFKRPDHKLTK